MPRHYWRKSDGKKSPTGDTKKYDKVGRPCKYDHHAVQKAKYLAWLRKNNQEMAEELGISEATLYTWFKTFPEFLETVNMAREDLNELAESCLWHRLQKREIRERIISESNGKKTTKVIVKELEPDLQAAIFQLSKCDPRYMEKKADDSEKGSLLEAIDNMKNPVDGDSSEDI